MNDILGMELHDCTLKDIKMSWGEKSVILKVKRYSTQTKKSFLQDIQFSNVSEILVPRKDSWGPSSSIYEITYENEQYLIKMQSGDEIRIVCPQIV